MGLTWRHGSLTVLAGPGTWFKTNKVVLTCCFAILMEKTSFVNQSAFGTIVQTFYLLSRRQGQSNLEPRLEGVALRLSDLDSARAETNAWIGHHPRGASW